MSATPRRNLSSARGARTLRANAMNDETDGTATTDSEAPATAPTPAPAPTPPTPEEERAIALDALVWCTAHPTEDTAVETLNTVYTLIHDAAVRAPWIAAARAVVEAVAQLPEPTPALHAHMTVLFAHLLELSTDSAMIDGLLAAWLRHPKSFGGEHTTPASYQRESFVQRLGDLLGWNSLDPVADRDALRRFAEWVDSWNPRNKFRSRRALQALARNFPAPDVWSRIYFPSEAPGSRPHGGGGRSHDHGRGPQGHGNAAPNAPNAPAVDEAEGDAPAPGNEAAPGTAPAATPAVGADGAPVTGTPGKRRRRRRGGRKNRGAANAGAAPGAPDADGNAAPSGDHDDGGGDDGGDDDGPGGNVADAPNGNTADAN